MDFNINYTVEYCLHCSFQFALPNAFISRRREDHKSFYCPACGNNMYWPQLSDKEKLRRKLKNQRRLETQLKNVQACCVEYEQKADQLEKSRRAFKGHVTRLKMKVA